MRLPCYVSLDKGTFLYEGAVLFWRPIKGSKFAELPVCKADATLAPRRSFPPGGTSLRRGFGFGGF